ncbi:MAG TPA: zinc ribbon domain-containing protein [Thermomicrobiales bacterium]|jgi:RNA polymerase subunit RPABC4/transcription elongation factor Spt4|nr:zinc ribbon domain-containing protein [Thermomicrobiales bacterium]
MPIEEVLARSAQIIVALIGAYLAVLWFVSIVWAYRDIEMRSRSVVTQIFSTLLVVLFPFIGIPLYLVLRPKDTLDAAFQKSLEEEYLLQDLEELPLCPSCHHYVSEDFVLCPHCHTQLRDNCVSCERLVDLRWSMCPYCGTEQTGRTTTAPVEAPAARWVRPNRGGSLALPGRRDRDERNDEQFRPVAATAGGSRTIGELVARRRVGPESVSESGRLTVVGGSAHRPDSDGEPRRGRFIRPAASETPADAPTSTVEQVPMRADGD